MDSFFKGLKVLELASVLAGPSVGQFFAELGADVLKIENKKQGGDITRSWKLASEDRLNPISAYYSSVNIGKKSLVLDLTDKYDYESLSREIERSNIIICNFKPGDAEKFGLDYVSVMKLNKHILYGEITGFGSSTRLAYDVVLQAESGFIAMTGSIDGELCKMPVALIDVLAAHQLKEGLLLAMLKQKEIPRAYKVSVSLFDSAIAALANQASNWLMGKHIAQPIGTLHPNIAPYGDLFYSKDDKQIVLAIGSDRQFKSLCDVLGLSAIASSELYFSNQNRLNNRKSLNELLEKQIKEYPRDELMTILLSADIPAGAVRKMDEVFEQEAAKSRIVSEFREGQQLIAVKGNTFKIEN